MKEFIFGAFVYKYQLITQDRKTLSLTVTPDLDIILKCPPKTDNERIEKFLQKKWFWLEKQLSFFKKYQRKLYQKEYLSGESFFYLGRQYKLVIRKSSEDKVALTKGKLMVNTKKDSKNTNYNKKLINTWFLDRAEKIFQERFEEMLKKFDYHDNLNFSIREMKRRWGSILKQKRVLLNPKLIHTPKECIDYVIAHELCHVKYKNHGKKFYELLKKKYPKWEKVKEKLEMSGSMI